MDLEKKADSSNAIDKSLLRAAKRGDTAALGKILEELRPYMLAVSNREMDDDLQAKEGGSDLVQQSFMEAHRDFDNFDGSKVEQLRAWVRDILLSNVRDFRRRYRDAAKRSVDREIEIMGDDSAAQLIEMLTPANRSPSESVQRQEDNERLLGAIEKLPEQYRTAIQLRNRDNLSFEEIGVRMERSAEAARKCWARAIQKLQQMLEEE